MTDHDAPPAGRRTDWRLIGLLVLLALPLRAWLFVNTEVTARDSIGYIRYALAFERQPWQAVWRANDQHPGYPLAVWAASQPVRWAAGRTDAVVMQRSAQLVSAAAALLLLVPMYLLGAALFDRRVGFAASLLYQYWPVSAHHLSDGISEPLFLLLTLTALYQAVRAVENGSVGRWALCGLFAGLAYLTRPEGLLVVPAAAAVLVGRQLVPAQRRPWGRSAAAGLGLAGSSLVAVALYVYATGRITNKLSALEVIHWLHRWAANGGGPALVASLFGATFPPADTAAGQVARSVWAVLAELNQGFHYVGSAAAALGLWGWRDRLRGRPGAWVVLIYLLIHTAVLVALARTVSYVSDRHTMVLVLGGTYLVAAGLCELSTRLAACCGRLGPTTLAALLVLGVVAGCLPKAVQRLHANRAGNRAAGRWLADWLQEGDVIVDDHAWSHYYSELFFQEGNERPLPAACRPTCYVVVTRSKDPDIRKDAEGRLQQAAPVYHWPERGDLAQARVVVYAQPRDWDSQRWIKLP